MTTTSTPIRRRAVAPGTVPSAPELRTGAQIRHDLLAIEKQLNGTFVQRHEAIRVILVSVLACQNYMLIGQPGTAKTSVIDCFTKHVRAPRFKILLGKFTQPEHIFGVLDINAFKQGRYETVTAGMFTESPFPILDEALKASDGCMNSLLGVLGPEREYQGQRTKNVCAGAATNWPEVDGLSKHVEALYDRFLMRVVVSPVDRTDKDARRALYRASERVPVYAPTVHIELHELEQASQEVGQVEISDEVLDLLDGLVGRLTAPKKTTQGKDAPPDMEVSDRRASQLQSVLRANAWLEGRSEVSIEDFDLLRHGLWSRRKDIESITAILDSVDVSLVQDLERSIEQGRQAYRQLVAMGFQTAQVNVVAEQIRKIALKVKDTLARPVLTKKSREKIRGHIKLLQQDFEELKARSLKAAGL